MRRLRWCERLRAGSGSARAAARRGAAGQQQRLPAARAVQRGAQLLQPRVVSQLPLLAQVLELLLRRGLPRGGPCAPMVAPCQLRQVAGPAPLLAS